MANTKINNFGKKLPPVKTGQRFGEHSQSNKKVGLFSERRFLILLKEDQLKLLLDPFTILAY